MAAHTSSARRGSTLSRLAQTRCGPASPSPPRASLSATTLLPLRREGAPTHPAMKQLHRQSSSMSKQHRPHHHRTSLTRTLASYLLREQRLLGFLLASSFFFLYPSLNPHSAAGSSTATSVAAAVARKIPPDVARRLPVGVRKPSLRVVVTGGARFVGSHLVDKLLARGDSVIVVDNFFMGCKDNVAHHLGNTRFELIRHDVFEPILLEVDQIYHLACPASPVHYKFNPIKTIKTNAMSTSSAATASPRPEFLCIVLVSSIASLFSLLFFYFFNSFNDLFCSSCPCVAHGQA